MTDRQPPPAINDPDRPHLISQRYEIGETLGYGGMSEVHLGRDVRLGREVAIKILRADLATDTVFQERFRREAQNSAALSHPAIVAVYDTGETPSEHGPLPYIVMEYVDGRTLRDIVKTEGPMDPKRAMEVMADVCAALDFSHRHGIVHRDVKPANVMISTAGAVKVMDFGIARAIHEGQSTMTQTAAVIGTAQYLSPEQARGESVDARSDVYAAGCVLYELIAGEPPFTGDSPVSVAYQHVREDPAPPSTVGRSISPELDAVVLKALTKGPANRYQSASEMRSDLVRVLSGQRPGAPMVMTEEDRTQVMAGAPASGEESYEEDPDAADESDRKSRRRKIAVALAVVAVFALGALLWLLNPFGGEDARQIPTLDGKRVNLAEEELRDAGFSNIQRNRVVCKPNEVDGDPVCDPEKYGQAQVFAVEPEEGSRVAVDEEIVLSYGQPPEKVDMPDLSGKSQSEANKIAEDNGLYLKTADERAPNDDPGRGGQVAEQEPGAGNSLREGDTVTVTLYEKPEMVEVTDYTGKKFEVADAGLSGAGFEVTRTDVDSSEAEGTVVSQDPSEGEAVQGSEIVLEVSNGAESEITMPDVIGKSEDDARSALEGAGHTGEINIVDNDVSDEDKDGEVSRSNPEADEDFKRNDSVTLHVDRYSDGNGGDDDDGDNGGGDDDGDNGNGGGGGRPTDDFPFPGGGGGN